MSGRIPIDSVHYKNMCKLRVISCKHMLFFFTVNHYTKQDVVS